MQTLLDFFNKDHGYPAIAWEDSVITQARNLTTLEIEKATTEIGIKILTELHSGARFFRFYIPKTDNTLGICKYLIERLDTFKKGSFDLDVYGSAYGEKFIGTRTYVFSNNIYLYSENDLTDYEEKQFNAFCTGKGIFVTFRSELYVKLMTEYQSPVAFISHDSHDKVEFAKPLALALYGQLCFVWYDEFSLRVGDSLRESIEKGIKEAKKCILLLTPNFLNNTSWTKKEFNSIFTREMIFEERIILPIWCGVTKEDVYEYSPSLVDTFALIWPDKNKLSPEEYIRDFNKLVTTLHIEVNKGPRI